MFLTRILSWKYPHSSTVENVQSVVNRFSVFHSDLIWTPVSSAVRYLCHRWCSRVPEDTSSCTEWSQAGGRAHSSCPSLCLRHSNTRTWSPSSCCSKSSDTGWSKPQWSRSLLGYLEGGRGRESNVRQTDRRQIKRWARGKQTKPPRHDLASENQTITDTALSLLSVMRKIAIEPQRSQNLPGGFLTKFDTSHLSRSIYLD